MQLRLLQQLKVLLSVLPIHPGVSLVIAISLFQNNTHCITPELFRYSCHELLVPKPASTALVADGETECGQLNDRIPCLEAKMICRHTNLPST